MMNSACLVATQTSFVSGPAFMSGAAVSQQSPVSRTDLWRPWLVNDQDLQTKFQRSKLACPYSRPTVPSNTVADGKTQPFQHPVRLFWPKSKSFDYLYSDGEALLRNFPVQATICFYDDSDSEDEEEDDWEEEEDDEEKEAFKPQSHFTNYN
ncbi:protein ripply1 isoform X2 [Trichomycterus rosablanca]|uniref:protein ripply1 isoform X2 n=1 Tax=Trichomycterus rosablanca TaxID=2290929 RepID=UPI002F34F924